MSKLSESIVNADHPRICMECRCKFCRDDCVQYIETRNDAYTAYGKMVAAYANQIGHIGLSKEFAEFLSYCCLCGRCKYRCTSTLGMIYYGKVMDVPKLVMEMRAKLVEEGKAPPDVRDVLENIVRWGNPYGVSKSILWNEEVNVKNALKEKTDVLLYIGTESPYDSRSVGSAKAAINVLKRSGINLGVLGVEEVNSGDLALRLGEKGLFEEFAERNLKLFQKTGISKIVVLSPHDYHTFLRDYPQEIKNFEVEHITTFLAKLIEEGRIKFGGTEKENTVVYKDPCYLGRHNGIFEEPREVVKSIGGLNLLEMDATKEMAVCCGGGGGAFWLKLRKRKRAAKMILDQCAGMNVDMLITACPMCTMMFKDELPGLEKGMEILNLVEVVEKYML